MDYKLFIQNELSKFRLVLNANNVIGDDWRSYMAIKMRLLKGQFFFENNPLWRAFNLKVQPLVRIRNGNVVWHDPVAGDTLTKVSVKDFNDVATSEKFESELKPVTTSVLTGGKIKVYFPSDNAEIFRPSAECVFQQLPDRLMLVGLMFEIRLSSADVRQCYDPVLKCHVASVILYYYGYPKNVLAMRERELPSPEPEDLDVPKVREVNKVREPEKPNKVIRTPLRSH